MKRSTQLVLLAVGAVLVSAIVVGVAIIALHGSGSASPVVTARLSAGGSTTTPPRGALVVAAESGSRAVALAVGRGRLTATVLSPSGDPESGLPVSFRVGGRVLKGDPCGDGCYTTAARRPSEVEVSLGSGPPVSFRIPAHAASATGIVRRATRVFRDLNSVVYVESLRSTPKGGLLTTWRMQAPDKLAYSIKNGASAVVIGNRRWDRTKASSAWRRSEQSPVLSVPVPAWGNLATNAHVLGTATVDGRRVWVVSFVNPSIPAWFTAWIDQKSYRPLRLRMTAASHFMFHRYLEFDKPLGISAPR